MAENKTKPTKADVAKYIKAIKDNYRREDCLKLLKIMTDITGEKPTLWGPSLIGFGTYHYKYASGHEGDFFLAGFSPRKQNISIYIMTGFEKYPELMEKLGKYKTGKSCLYVKSLEDINLPVLKKLIKQSVAAMKKAYPS